MERIAVLCWLSTTTTSEMSYVIITQPLPANHRLQCIASTVLCYRPNFNIRKQRLLPVHQYMFPPLFVIFILNTRILTVMQFANTVIA